MSDRSAKDIIAAARRPERTYDVCLRGDLQATWEALDRQLGEATRSGAGSLEGDARIEIAQQMDQVREQMQGAVITLTLRALPRPDYRDLEAKHPPRKPTDAKQLARAKADGDDSALAAAEQADAFAARDKQAGFNTDTFYTALMRACLVDPELDEVDWKGLDEAMTDRQFDELANLALVLNRGEVGVPFSPTASRLIRSSEPN